MFRVFSNVSLTLFSCFCSHLFRPSALHFDAITITWQYLYIILCVRPEPRHSSLVVCLPTVMLYSLTRCPYTVPNTSVRHWILHVSAAFSRHVTGALPLYCYCGWRAWLYFQVCHWVWVLLTYNINILLLCTVWLESVHCIFLIGIFFYNICCSNTRSITIIIMPNKTGHAFIIHHLLFAVIKQGML